MSDPLILTVDAVGERLARGVPRWTVHHIDQYGNGGGKVFPKEQLEWRAAEYGLTDVDEILDMILHEWHLPDFPDRDDAAARVGLVTSVRADAEPITLMNAASTPDALAAHRLRIAEAKLVTAHVRPPSKGKDPLDIIRTQHGITAAGVREKREVVDIHRWLLVYGNFPAKPRSMALEVPRA
ncbi:hypothetical protein [Streptomyces prunicolor]